MVCNATVRYISMYIRCCVRYSEDTRKSMVPGARSVSRRSLYRTRRSGASVADALILLFGSARNVGIIYNRLSNIPIKTIGMNY